MSFHSKPTGYFLDDGHWVDDHLAVEFTLELNVGDNTQEICCRVYGNALYDAGRRNGPLIGDEAVEFYQRFRSRIHDEVDRKLKAGNFDGDNLIIVRTADLSG